MEKDPKEKQKAIPKTGLALSVGLLVMSALIHVVSVVEVPRFASLFRKEVPVKKERMKVRVVSKPKQKPKPKDSDPTQPKKILESKQSETEAPKVATHKGHQNHATEKETRVRPVPKMPGMDPGTASVLAKKSPQAQPSKVQKKHDKKTADKPMKRLVKQSKQKLTSPTGKVQIAAEPTKKAVAGSRYEQLLPSSEELSHHMRSGYQDYLDEKLTVGDKIDINTSDYRYIGYFTMMRKSIELVWNYPSSAARRGHQGVVGLQFTIYQDGQVKNLKVVDSSGYKILDDSIIEAIRMASPFAPLPAGFNKKKMVITGNFRYILNSFAVGH